jgi:hypothetical protein
VSLGFGAAPVACIVKLSCKMGPAKLNLDTEMVLDRE